MRKFPRFLGHLHWINLPGALLIALLQRTPALRVAATAEELVIASPIGAVLRSAMTAAASLGALQALVGATQFITNRPSPISATVGQAIAPVFFTYTGTPTPPASFLIVGSLPPGLAFIPPLTASGVVDSSAPNIIGTPVQAGVFTISVQGYNSRSATGLTNGVRVPITFNVAGATAVAPVIVSQPVNQSVPAGRPVTLSVAASGTPAPAYQWLKNGAAIPGATNASFAIASAQASDAGNYSVFASNSAGSVNSGIATLTVTANPLAPVFAAQPQSQTIATGNTVVFSADAGAGVRYQWQRNGVDLPGATSATLVLSGTAAVVPGNYAAVAGNADGATTSTMASLTVVTTADAGRLGNLSILTSLAPGETMTMGTVLGGGGTSGAKPLLVRTAGPALAQLGVTGFLPDPRMTLVNTSTTPGTTVAINDNWNGASALSNAFAQFGAFAYATADSRDAALFQSGGTALAPGNYTVQVSDVGSGSGTVIAELYDATPAGTFTAATPRLINVSVLKSIDAGGSLTAGFFVGGTTAKTVLIRAIGPTLGLAPFLIEGAMPDPQLTLFNSRQQVIATNSDWGGDPQLTSTGDRVGAFAAANGSSKDAMLLITLASGASYTAQVSPVGAGGIVIIEVYEVP